MADAAKNFRSSLHGFNRDDVIAYIEKTSLEHEKDLRALRDANVRLQTELDEAQLAAKDTTELDEAKAARAAAEKETAELRAKLAKLQEDYDALEAKQAEQAAAPVQPKAETPLNAPMPSVAQFQAAPVKDYTELELAAYRRAEVAERLARERAGKIYEQLDTVFANANTRFADSENDLNMLTKSLQTNVEQMQQVLCTIRNIHAETEESFLAVGKRNREFAEENR